MSTEEEAFLSMTNYKHLVKGYMQQETAPEIDNSLTTQAFKGTHRN